MVVFKNSNALLEYLASLVKAEVVEASIIAAGKVRNQSITLLKESFFRDERL